MFHTNSASLATPPPPPPPPPINGKIRTALMHRLQQKDEAGGNNPTDEAVVHFVNYHIIG